MKDLYKYIIAFFLVVTVTACNEDILNEEPLDFLSPENSYTKPANIEAALFMNYRRVLDFYDGRYNRNFQLHTGTDLAVSGWNPPVEFLGDYVAQLTTSAKFVLQYWSDLYGIIFDANTVLNRLEDIEYPSQAEKDLHIAEARFFRGFAYRHLVYLYGGVPITLEETSSPKRDYVRASKEETVDQAIADIEFAAEHLPGVTEVAAPGRLNSAAALHVLAELFIAKGDLNKAITAATAVIDDPDISLMTTRFGHRADDDGDPYWDLFQRNNQNRGNGNTEGILVLQEEFDIPGGSSAEKGEPGICYERNYGPLYWYIKDPDGNSVFFGPSTQNGGRPAGFIRPTVYVTHTIWGDGNWDLDVRNHERNIRRDWVVDNPSSAYYGQKVSDFPQSWFDGLTAEDTMRDYFPYIMKVTTVNDHPPGAVVDPATGLMYKRSGKTHTDWYLMRVAETYLLRAEAYLALGNKSLAAADINMVRNRAGAIPVTEADVDIDYILDERLRELNWEEPRRLTLSRLNLLYERTILGNSFSGKTIQPHNNLLPIPYSEIERNTLAKLEQNPGYAN